MELPILLTVIEFNKTVPLSGVEKKRESQNKFIVRIHFLRMSNRDSHGTIVGCGKSEITRY